MSLYTDILIEDFDLATEGGFPLPVSNAGSIGQDIKHLILESGYLTQMIAERNRQLRKGLEQQIELLAESDQRIVPGTVVLIEQLEPGQYELQAETIHHGNFTVTVDPNIIFNPVYADKTDNQWPGVQDKSFGDQAKSFTEDYMANLWGDLIREQ